MAVPQPHWLPSSIDSTAAIISASSAAPGLRTISAASTAGRNQIPASPRRLHSAPPRAPPGLGPARAARPGGTAPPPPPPPPGAADPPPAGPGGGPPPPAPAAPLGAGPRPPPGRKTPPPGKLRSLQ